MAGTPLHVSTTTTHVASPLGPILLTGRPGVLTGLYVADHERCPIAPEGSQRDDDVFADAAVQLGEYFAGERHQFKLDINLAGTEFQQQVWAALQAIPYGQTISYGELARRVGRPNAVRAAGSANGRNPVSIIVPCHRVIGADGRLSGYGWGPQRKAWLLDLEGADGGQRPCGLQHSEP